MRLRCAEEARCASSQQQQQQQQQPPPAAALQLQPDVVGLVELAEYVLRQRPSDYAALSPEQTSRMPGPQYDHDMDLCTDKVLSKARILRELTKAVKLVYAQSLHGTVVLDGDSWLVYWLDRALRHGLRIERHGYWGTVRELSHQDTVVVIHALQSVLTSIGKGRAWLYHTLSEGSFESYLACMLRDVKTLKKQYFPHALVRDADKTNQLINLLVGLENVSFTLQLDVTYLDICNYMPRRPMSGSPPGTALSLHLRSGSLSSSLASPGDSGVALDSDMDAANETDASSYKEEDWSTKNVVRYRNKYKLINDCANDNKNSERSFSSSDSSDDNKTPKLSPVAPGKFHNAGVTKSDIINQNLTSKLDDNDLNCSSLDTIKGCNYYGKSPEDTNQPAKTDAENNGILLSGYNNRRDSYYGSSSSDVSGSYSFKKAASLLDQRGHYPRNSYVINNDTNLLELSMTISDCENTEAPYSILNTVNMSDTTMTCATAITTTSSSILSSSGSEALVQRRQCKKKRGETKKRVSFHEDIFKLMKLDDDENYVEYTARDNKRDYGQQQGRYSWCGQGDAAYPQKPGRNAFSDCYSSASSLSAFESSEAERKSCSARPPAGCHDGNDEDCLEATKCACIAMAERGAPEGQEDPARALRPKIEIELEENEAQEAYIAETECGNIVEDPPVKLEMPGLPNNNNNNNDKPQEKYASSSDWSDLESVTTTSDYSTEDQRRGSNGNNNNNNNNNDTNSSSASSSRHLASPARKRNLTTTTVLSGGESSRYLAGQQQQQPQPQPPSLRQAPSKASLLSRFLRSITERKLELKDRKSTPRPSSGLMVKRAKVDPEATRQFNEALDKEMRENATPGRRELSGERVAAKMREVFKRNIYRDKTEELYKAYKVRSSYMTNGESKPMLALLTDKTLYLTGIKGNHAYSNQFVIPYNELDVIMIGPNAQTILISNADYEMQYLFSTGSSRTTSELIGHLEMAMRRSPSKPRLPAVKELNYDDMHTLKHSILADTAVHPDEKIEHYSLIFMEDDHISPPTSPCGPTKEGDLMFRPHVYGQSTGASSSPWEAGYFVLKGGVVYMFTDNNQRLPKRAIPLKGGLCQGCRRIPNSHRPHTFEILLKPNKAFQFAAPDEYVASEWLQSFVQSASGLFGCSEKRDPLPCSLVVTSRHLVAMKEVFPGTQRGQTLSCASIEDLSAFRVPLAQQSWCILEFACREVHESSGDWVVYFTNYRELCDFQKVLERLWADAKLGEFPMCTLPSEDKLQHRCSNASKSLEQAWRHLLPIETD